MRSSSTDCPPTMVWLGELRPPGQVAAGGWLSSVRLVRLDLIASSTSGVPLAEGRRPPAAGLPRLPSGAEWGMVPLRCAEPVWGLAHNYLSKASTVESPDWHPSHTLNSSKNPERERDLSLTFPIVRSRARGRREKGSCPPLAGHGRGRWSAPAGGCFAEA